MTRRIVAFLLALLLVPSFALASRQYIIPDSDTRALTETELWGWDYESLGYILNEIFARHGYCFIPGGAYDQFFRERPWYQPNTNTDNSVACYPKLSSLEWSNERLVKDVRAQMRAQNTRNTGGKHYWKEVYTDEFDVLSGFTLINLSPGQKLGVYSAPSTSSYRGAGGKALVSTNGTVYAAGWDGGWLLVMYQTNKGAVRVGYVDGAAVKGTVNAPSLRFERIAAACASAAPLTDDPATQSTSLRTLAAGESVVYLASYYNANAWAYVETTVEGKTARGFIPADALAMAGVADESDQTADQ